VQSQDYEYKREGVVDLYLVCEPLVGHREIFVIDNHNRLNWAEVVRIVAEEMHPNAERITIICDNLAAHKPSALYEILVPSRARNILRRIEFIHTPKHESWLNVAENELSVLKRVGIAKRVGSREELEKQIADYQERRNKRGVKVERQFSTKDARVKLKKLYPPLKP
jgi:transposase